MPGDGGWMWCLRMIFAGRPIRFCEQTENDGDVKRLARKERPAKTKPDPENLRVWDGRS